MQAFAELHAALQAAPSAPARCRALQRYFAQRGQADAAWACYLLAGARPFGRIAGSTLRDVACALAGLPAWLFDACLHASGELAETLALVLPPPGAVSCAGLAHWAQERLLPLQRLPAAQQEQALGQCWAELAPAARRVLNLHWLGAWRAPLPQALLAQCLATSTPAPAALLALRLPAYARMANGPTEAAWRALLAPAQSASEAAALARAVPPPPAAPPPWSPSAAPLHLRAVLIHAQAGPPPLYTLALWSRVPANEDEAQAAAARVHALAKQPPGALQLVSLGKCESALAARDAALLSAHLRSAEVGRAGPVRLLAPGLVFELAFDAVAPSPRRRSGLALLRPRMLHALPEAALMQAHSLADACALLQSTSQPPALINHPP